MKKPTSIQSECTACGFPDFCWPEDAKTHVCQDCSSYGWPSHGKPKEQIKTLCLGFVVELEPGVWLCDEIEGDPGRTLVLDNATRYPTLLLAEAGIDRAKKYRTFCNHDIRPIFKKP